MIFPLFNPFSLARRNQPQKEETTEGGDERDQGDYTTIWEEGRKGDLPASK